MIFSAACIALILASLSAVLFVKNLELYVPPRQGVADDSGPAISILIPARNESTNIASAIESVLANKSANFEVIVADDHSEDGTAAIVRSFAGRDARVRLISTPPLPAGWNGKQHACYYLAKAATHPLLCFIDADIRLSNDALAKLANLISESGSALISGIPLQKTETWLEKLEIPLIHFVLLGYLPIHRMRSTTDPAYAAGCGQLLVMEKEAYEFSGGHAAIRYTMHDGIKLPILFRKAGFKTDLFDATQMATVRMYSGARQVWDGLSKNATEGMATPKLLPIFTTLLFGGHVLPFVVLPLAVAHHNVGAAIVTSVAIGFSYIPRLLGVTRFQQSMASAFLHPLGIMVLLGIQWAALGNKLLGKSSSWRGRSYSQPTSIVPSEKIGKTDPGDIRDFNPKSEIPNSRARRANSWLDSARGQE